MASGIIEAKYPALETTAATDLVGAQNFFVTAFKMGNLVICSYILRYSSVISAGTPLFSVQYKPKNAFLTMIMNVDGTAGFPLNTDVMGIATPFNPVGANKYYEGSIIYFTDP